MGGFANLTNEYATKRYRSNLINWGILPFRTGESLHIPVGSYLLAENIRRLLESGGNRIELKVLDETGICTGTLSCTLDQLTEDERKILLAGSLINYYRS